LAVKDRTAPIAGIDRRIYLKDPFDALRPYRRDMPARDRDLSQAEWVSDDDHFLIQLHGPGIADGRIRESDRLNLEQGEVLIRIGSDHHRGRPKLARGHHDDASRVRHHMVCGQDVAVAVDNHAGPGRPLGRSSRVFGRTDHSGA
jgi:hypothetical protein